MPDWIDNELAEIEARSETRHLEAWTAPGPTVERDGQTYLNLAGNDYLGLVNHPGVREAAARAAREIGSGSTASRLLAGTFKIHDDLEQQLAAWKGHPAALLFSSGYLAALGAITVLAGRDDLIVADRLSHACLLDAARLSGARLVRFKHNDLGEARRLLAHRGEYRRCLLITESVFSMDGDQAPVADLLELAEAHDTLLLVDEAHALGACGPRGAGLTADAPAIQQRLITLGTLGKALASAGGFITCSTKLRELLINRARSFIFDTALPPPSVAAAQAALNLLLEHPEWPGLLQERAQAFAGLLRERGVPVMAGASHIVPVLVGASDRTMEIAKRIRNQGVLAGAIRPPTVPPHLGRLRLTVTLSHTPEALTRAAEVLGQAFAEPNRHA